MALAGAALLGVVSTFSWSNVFKSGKADGKAKQALVGPNAQCHHKYHTIAVACITSAPMCRQYQWLNKSTPY